MQVADNVHPYLCGEGIAHMYMFHLTKNNMHTQQHIQTHTHTHTHTGSHSNVGISRGTLNDMSILCSISQIILCDVMLYASLSPWGR